MQPGTDRFARADWGASIFHRGAVCAAHAAVVKQQTAVCGFHRAAARDLDKLEFSEWHDLAQNRAAMPGAEEADAATVAAGVDARQGDWSGGVRTAPGSGR